MLSNKGGYGDGLSTRMQHALSIYGQPCFCRQLWAWLRSHYATLTPNTQNGHSPFWLFGSVMLFVDINSKFIKYVHRVFTVYNTWSVLNSSSHIRRTHQYRQNTSGLLVLCFATFAKPHLSTGSFRQSYTFKVIPLEAAFTSNAIIIYKRYCAHGTVPHSLLLQQLCNTLHWFPRLWLAVLLEFFQADVIIKAGRTLCAHGDIFLG